MSGVEPPVVPGGGADSSGRPGGGMVAVFLEHLPLVEKVAKFRARRANLQPQDVEDFIAEVKVKLIGDDYRVLRQHRGDSSLPTFLTTVVQNLFKDYCNHKFGKFRPSAKAKKLGRTALELERLIVRDHRTVEAAVAIVVRRPEVDESREQLLQLASELRRPERPQEVGDEILENRPMPSADSAAEKRVVEQERGATAARVESVLNKALSVLSRQDLLILKMHFRDGCTVATIASALRLEQRPLYTRKEKCFAQLRQVFAREGLTWEEVREILGWNAGDIRGDFGDRSGDSPTGPSNLEVEK